MGLGATKIVHPNPSSLPKALKNNENFPNTFLEDASSSLWQRCEEFRFKNDS